MAEEIVPVSVCKRRGYSWICLVIFQPPRSFLGG